MTSENQLHRSILYNVEAVLPESKGDRMQQAMKTLLASTIVKKRANKKPPVETFGKHTTELDGSELR
jgi:hypothetical protein